MFGERKKYDSLVIFLYLAMVIFGWVNIYAACLSDDHRALFDFSVKHGKQLIWIFVSVLIALVICVSNANIFSNGAYIFYVLAVLLLLATLVVGNTTNGAQSWIDFGFFKLQPSEFSKFATALAVSKYISGIDVNLKQRRTRYCIIGIIALPALIILIQGDMGSTLVFVAFLIPFFRLGMPAWILWSIVIAITLFVLSLLVNRFILVGVIIACCLFYLYVWLNDRHKKEYIRTIAVALVCIGFVFSVDMVVNHVLKPHQANRIKVLVDPSIEPDNIGYNVRQSKIAIGSGGIFGKGFTNGTITKADFVPEQETDFIFCTVGEEWGFLGSLGVLAAFLLLLWHLVTMAERQRSIFSRFYGYTVSSILFFHVMVNVGMVLGLVPVIGIPLPFFSYGGSSLFSFTVLLFIFVRLDADSNKLF